MSNCIAGTYHITCDQGATFKRTITWTDSARKAIDLSAYTARMQVRPTVTSQTLIIQLTTSNNRISLGNTEQTKGQINLLISATDTALLTPGIYKYDLELVSGNGEVTRLIEGNFNVKAEVTR